MTALQASHTLDCVGLKYPSPILKAEQALAEMHAGQVLEVVTDDINTRPDLKTWAARAGSELITIADEEAGRYRFWVRKSGAAPQPAQPEAGEKLFLVVLNSGFDYTPIARSAFMYASLAAAMGFETVVYCVQAGADTMVKDKVTKLDQSKPGQPTILQRFQEAQEMGVRVEVCEQTANVRGIRAEDLIGGVTLRGGAVLIDYAARCTGQLTF